MKSSFILGVSLAVGWAIGVSPLTQADEAAQEGHHVNCPEVGVPILDKVPYVSRLFKNVGTGAFECIQIQFDSNAPCAIKCTTQEGDLERIGVDFNVIECVAVEEPCKIAVVPASCDKANACKTAACKTASKQCCKSACGSLHQVAVKAKCACGDSCACAKVAKANCACGDSCKCAKTAKTAKKHKHDFGWETVARKAKALKVKLESREQIESERAELLEALMDAREEVARLQAHVELAEQKEQMMKTVMETMTENVRLKAQLQTVSQQHQVHQHQQRLQQTVTHVTNENAALKARLAILEQQLHEQSGEAHTAESHHDSKRRR